VGRHVSGIQIHGTAGRRAGFLVGPISAAAGGTVSVVAIFTHQFVLFCLGISCIGVYQAFAGYYRYAAADLFPPEQRGRAISAVLSGGVIAAVGGPFLATAVKDTLPAEFAGSYALVTVLALISTGLIALLAADGHLAGDTAAAGAGPAAAGDDAPPRTLGQIARQPIFLAGVTGSSAGYLVMMVLMTAAPIAAVHVGHTVDQGAQVIQWHTVGMYATAFVSGPLTRPIGAARTLLLGGATTAVGAATATVSMAQLTFMVALGLIGVGWNLMYVAVSALIANSYRPAERSTAQGVGEIFTLGGSAVGALAAGPLLAIMGWRPMVDLMLAPLAVSALVTLGYLYQARWRAA
jgi:MFS family permease